MNTYIVAKKENGVRYLFSNTVQDPDWISTNDLKEGERIVVSMFVDEEHAKAVAKSLNSTNVYVQPFEDFVKSIEVAEEKSYSLEHNTAIKEHLSKIGFKYHCAPGYLNTQGVPYWRLRIHELTWLEIDINGFVTVKRNHENSKQVSAVTLPKPVRSTRDLEGLMAAVVGF
jgi:hypothetical protein